MKQCFFGTVHTGTPHIDSLFQANFFEEFFSLYKINRGEGPEVRTLGAPAQFR